MAVGPKGAISFEDTKRIAGYLLNVIAVMKSAPDGEPFMEDMAYTAVHINGETTILALYTFPVARRAMLASCGG